MEAWCWPTPARSRARIKTICVNGLAGHIDWGSGALCLAARTYTFARLAPVRHSQGSPLRLGCCQGSERDNFQTPSIKRDGASDGETGKPTTTGWSPSYRLSPPLSAVKIRQQKILQRSVRGALKASGLHGSADSMLAGGSADLGNVQTCQFLDSSVCKTR